MPGESLLTCYVQTWKSWVKQGSKSWRNVFSDTSADTNKLGEMFKKNSSWFSPLTSISTITWLTSCVFICVAPRVCLVFRICWCSCYQVEGIFASQRDIFSQQSFWLESKIFQVATNTNQGSVPFRSKRA